MKNEENKNTQKAAGSSENSQAGNSVAAEANKGGGQTGVSARQAPESAGAAGQSAQGSGEQENLADVVTGSAQGLLEKAKDTAGQAYGMVSEKATEKLDEQKTTITSGLASVAGSIKQVGESLRGAEEPTGLTETTAKYGDRLAGQIEQISNYFEQNDVRAIVGDVEDFARRNPAVFIGGAFVLGILAARFLKSSKPAAEGASGGAGRANRNAREDRNIVAFESGASGKNTSSTRDSIKDPM